MNTEYHGTDKGVPRGILVAYHLDTPEGFWSLCTLLLAWRGPITLVYLDEYHVVAVLGPGGAMRLMT